MGWIFNIHACIFISLYNQWGKNRCLYRIRLNFPTFFVSEHYPLLYLESYLCYYIHVYPQYWWMKWFSLRIICRLPNSIAEILIILHKWGQISKNIEPVIWGHCIKVLVASDSNDDNDNEMPLTPLRTTLINKFGRIMISYVVVRKSSQNLIRSCLFLLYHWALKSIRSYMM